MRLGIRARLLLTLAALLALGLVPLYYAVTRLGEASLGRAAEQSAHGLGRAVAGHLAGARSGRSDAALDLVLEAQIGGSVLAAGLYDERGAIERRAGDPAAAQALPATVAHDREVTAVQPLETGTAILVSIPGPAGPVGVLVAQGASSEQAGPLGRLVALYTALLGLALLLVCHVAITRMVVLPVEQLSRAARRVEEGARKLSAPSTGGRELAQLGRSLERMTERLRAEEEKLRQKVDELEAATVELKQAQRVLIRSERLASVGRLAAGLAHEIGNPLAAVLGLLELLGEEGLSQQEQRDFLARITRETERIHRVLRDLLDFARPAVRDAGREGATDQEGSDAAALGSVATAVEHVLALLGPQKTLASVVIEQRIADGLPAVAMHQARVEQVLLNLLLNAADQVPPERGRIVVEAEAASDAVRVAVEDNGGGIDPSVRERLFEPFVSTKEIGKGTGLGLAVCRGLIEAAGGTIEVSDGADGARFVLELPLAREPSEEPSPEP